MTRSSNVELTGQQVLNSELPPSRQVSGIEQEGSVRRVGIGEKENAGNASGLDNCSAKARKSTPTRREVTLVSVILLMISVAVVLAATLSDGGKHPKDGQHNERETCIPVDYTGNCTRTRVVSECESVYTETGLVQTEKEGDACTLFYDNGLVLTFSAEECEAASATKCAAIGAPDYCGDKGLSMFCNERALCRYLSEGNVVKVDDNALLTSCTDGVGDVTYTNLYDIEGPTETEIKEMQLIIDRQRRPSLVLRDNVTQVGEVSNGVLYSINVTVEVIVNVQCDVSLETSCAQIDAVTKAVVNRPRWEWPCSFASEYSQDLPPPTAATVLETCGASTIP